MAGKIFSGIGVSLSVGYAYTESVKSVSPATKGLVYQAGISKKIFPKVRGTLAATREITNDFDSALFRTDNLIKDFYGIALSWQAAPRISVNANASVGYNTQDGYIAQPDADNPTNLYTRAREDQLYKWGIQINWLPRPFFNVALAYEYLNQNASFKDLEYYANRFLASLDYKF